MKVKLIVFCILVLLLLTPITAKSMETMRYVTYAIHTGEDFTMGWDASEGATYYNVRAKHYEQNEYVTDGSWNKINNVRLTVKIVRGGHWIFEVQACKPDLFPDEGGPDPAPDLCSNWSTSINPPTAIVDGVAEPWWVYAYIAPPGGGVIENK